MEMQELSNLDQDLRQFIGSYQVFLDAFKHQLERIDEMERMLENLRREQSLKK